MLFKAELKHCKGCVHLLNCPTGTPPYFSGFKFVCSREKTCLNYSEYEKRILSEQEKEKWRIFNAN
jgi:hypothetical protein